MNRYDPSSYIRNILLCLAITSLMVTSLSGQDSLTTQLDTMHISAKRPGSSTKIDIREVEAITGQTDDLNTIFGTIPLVARIPEAQSQIISKGENPYETRFVLQGIPLFMIGHFGGSVYADRSAAAIAVPQDIQFINKGLGGTYSGSPGAVVIINPGYIPDEKKYKARPHLALNLGTIGGDISLVVPVRDTSDHYQISYKASDNYMLRALVNYGNESAVASMAGTSVPSSFADFQFLGSQCLGRFHVHQLLWLCEDRFRTLDNLYSSNVSRVIDGNISIADPFEKKESVYPWGVVAATVDDSSNHFRYTLGGARQYSFEAKRIGQVFPAKSLAANSIAASFETFDLKILKGTLSSKVFFEYAQWAGTIKQQINLSYIYGPIWITQDTTLFVHNTGVSGAAGLHVGYSGATTLFRYGLNVNGGVFTNGIQPFIDPGISINIPFALGRIDFNTGIVTSQSDPRGLPQGEYASRTIHTGSADLSTTVRPVPYLSTTINAFVKYKDHVPLLSDNAVSPVWNAYRNARFIAGGAGATVDLSIGKYSRLTSVQSFSTAQVIENGRNDIYQWDIPWTNYTVLSQGFLNDRMKVFAIGSFSAGLPFRDPVLVPGDSIVFAGPWHRVPDYKCLDLKIQYSVPIENHRYLQQIDSYILLENVVEGLINVNPNWDADRNVREYYWDAEFNRRPINLKKANYSLCVRVMMRL